MKDEVLRLFAERGVTVNDIAVIVHHLQNPHMPDLTMEECVESIHRVLEKREVQHAVLTGIALDILAEKDLLPEPLLSIVKRDEPLYGVDEILALAVTNVYGSVGLTSFGYLDKRKLGVIKRLNSHEQGRVHTFLDDMVAAVAAAAAARIAHQRKAQAEDRPMLEDNSDLYPRGEQAPPAQAASR
ncbi:MAG: phosphatidylglycerophosphatase A [Limnochordales bacterium]